MVVGLGVVVARTMAMIPEGTIWRAAKNDNRVIDVDAVLICFRQY
jgi:hypothetical protein